MATEAQFSQVAELTLVQANPTLDVSQVVVMTLVYNYFVVEGPSASAPMTAVTPNFTLGAPSAASALSTADQSATNTPGAGASPATATEPSVSVGTDSATAPASALDAGSSAGVEAIGAPLSVTPPVGFAEPPAIPAPAQTPGAQGITVGHLQASAPTTSSPASGFRDELRAQVSIDVPYATISFDAVEASLLSVDPEAIMSAVQAPNPFDFNLTKRSLSQMRPARRPYYAGSTWSFRFRVATSNGTARSLALVTAVNEIRMRIRPRLDQDAPLLERSSSTNRAGISPTIKQIVPDSNQVTEVLDDDGNPVSGKGWATVYFDPEDLEDALTILGTSHYSVEVEWISEEVEPVLSGLFETLRSA